MKLKYRLVAEGIQCLLATPSSLEQLSKSDSHLKDDCKNESIKNRCHGVNKTNKNRNETTKRNFSVFML